MFLSSVKFLPKYKTEENVTGYLCLLGKMVKHTNLIKIQSTLTVVQQTRNTYISYQKKNNKNKAKAKTTKPKNQHTVAGQSKHTIFQSSGFCTKHWSVMTAEAGAA